MMIRSLRTASTLFFAFPLILAACGGSDAPKEGSVPTPSQEAPAPEPPAAAAPDAAAMDSSKTEWRLTAVEVPGGAAISPSGEAVPTLQFDPEPGPNGMLGMAGFSGCSQFFTMYSVQADGSLSIPVPIATKETSDCAEAAQKVEAALIKSLGSASGFSIDSDELTIRSEDGTLRFKRG
jgi:heat shock protein HslJ